MSTKYPFLGEFSQLIEEGNLLSSLFHIATEKHLCLIVDSGLPLLLAWFKNHLFAFARLETAWDL